VWQAEKRKMFKRTSKINGWKMDKKWMKNWQNNEKMD
jgi:hypothetical protein